MGCTSSRRTSRGTILGTCLLLLTLLTTLGVGLLNAALNANTVARHEINAKRALAVAEAGIAHARRLIAVNHSTTSLSGRLAGATSSSPEVALAGFTKVEGLGPGNGTYNVSVANNLVAYNKTPGYGPDPAPAVDTDNRIWIKSTGIFRNTTRIIRVLVDFTSVLNPPGAITLIDGASPDSATFNGNAFSIDGTDKPAPTSAGACGTPGAAKYAISVNSATSLASLTTEVAGNQKDNITGAGGWGSYANNGTISRTSLEKVVTALLPLATALPGGSDSANHGTPAAPGIFVAKSNLKLGGSGKGYGILIVTGGAEFEITGNYRWEGLILVLGTGSVSISGGGELYGALLAANTQGGTTELTVNGNGGGGTYYSSQALCRLRDLVPTSTVLAWQEVR